MAPIDFYYMPESPPCRAVEMVANILNVPLNKHYVNLGTGDHMKEENLKINPNHRIPFIVDGDLKLGESRAIIQYLVNKYGGSDNALYPTDPVKRARVDEFIHVDGASLYPSISQLYRPIIFKNKPIDQEGIEYFKKNLTLIENQLATNGGKKYLVGDEITIADITIAASLTFVDCCSIDISEFKLVVPYLDRIKTDIPNYKEINDEATANMKKYLESKLAESK